MLTKVLKNLILLLCSLAATILLIFTALELFPPLIRALRLTGIHYYGLRERYIIDPQLVFRIKPFYKIKISDYKGDLYLPGYKVDVEPIQIEFQCDKDGFRNANYISSADTVIVGDSYIEVGRDDSDTFSGRFARHSGLSVKNIGIGWWGPIQYLIALERHALRVNPKYAVFCFFEGNDMQDIIQYARWYKGKAYYHFNFCRKNFFQRLWIAVTDTVNFIRSSFREKFARRNSPTIRDNKGVDIRWSEVNLADKSIKTVFCYQNDLRPASVLLKAPEYIILSDVLRAFKKICVGNNIVPLLVFIPTRTHVYAPYSSAVRGGPYWLKVREKQIAARQNIEDAITALCRDNGIRMISLTPKFESLAKEGKFLYYPFDSHWNSEGREAAARYVAEEIRK
jgi:hypothetical protein